MWAPSAPRESVGSFHAAAFAERSWPASALAFHSAPYSSSRRSDAPQPLVGWAPTPMSLAPLGGDAKEFQVCAKMLQPHRAAVISVSSHGSVAASWEDREGLLLSAKHRSCLSQFRFESIAICCSGRGHHRIDRAQYGRIQRHESACKRISRGSENRRRGTSTESIHARSLHSARVAGHAYP